MIGSNSAIADIVPVDICANMMIAIAWHTATKRLAEENLRMNEPFRLLDQRLFQFIIAVQVIWGH